MLKKELRKIYREKRAKLSIPEKGRLEDLLLIRFQQLNIHIPSMIMTYAPFEDEFDPQLILDYCHFKNPQQQLFYPVINYEHDKLHAVAVNEQTLFALNRHGIDEPVNGIPAFAEEIDLLIVPLLAFDIKGYRVGYGKGYYDRFLKECKKDAVKVGFSFFDPENAIDDIHDYDIQLDHCITPGKIYNF